MSHDGGVAVPLKNRSEEKCCTDQGKMAVAAQSRAVPERRQVLKVQ